MDQYADDLAELVETLDLHDAIMVGHSTGGGEVARYVGRHSTDRVAKAVLVGAVPPLMLKTQANRPLERDLRQPLAVTLARRVTVIEPDPVAQRAAFRGVPGTHQIHPD